MKRIRGIKRNCYYYNLGDNSNFEYECPTSYGARCEFYDKFFTVKSVNMDNLDPDCSICDGNNLEERVNEK